MITCNTYSSFISSVPIRAAASSVENRYILERKTEDAVTELFCGIPIRSRKGTTTDGSFSFGTDGPAANGTNCKLRITNDKLILSGKNGTVTVGFNGSKIPSACTGGAVCGGKVCIQAASNGAVFSCRCAPCEKITLNVATDIANEAIRKNNKYVAFMKKPFRPTFTIASLYAVSADGKRYRPLILESKSGNLYRQEIEFSSAFNEEHINVFEINMYEPKLMQDTTVESATATQNNAYGATAFVGRTDEYGEQWLYLKANLHALAHLKDRKLLSAKLHIPIINGSGEHVQAFMLPSRFCSFGSNWNNKLAYIPDAIAEKSCSNANYVTFDVTRAIAEGLNKGSKESAGVLIKSLSKTECALLATGDCYAFPQLLEVEYI